MGLHRQHLTLACFLPTHSNPTERLTKRCQALHPTAGTTYTEGPEVGPTASNHLQATVAESGGLLAEEWRVESGQGAIILSSVIIIGGFFSMPQAKRALPTGQLFKSENSSSLTLSSPLWLHLAALDCGLPRVVEQAEPHPGLCSPCTWWLDTQQAVSKCVLQPQQTSQALECRVTVKMRLLPSKQSVCDIQHLAF